MEPPATRIAGFDGLRALAVLAVFAAHRAALPPGHHLGFWGVAAFFCLSGYLITQILHGYRLEIERSGATAWGQYRRFLYRRTLRIAPIYYLTLAVAVMAGLWLSADELTEGVEWHALYLSNIYIGVVRGEWIGHLSHLWSLAAEEQFYLLFAPLLLFSPARWHARLCAGVAAGGLASAGALGAIGAPEVLYYTTPTGSFGLLASGGLFALKGERILERRAVRIGFAALAAATGLLIAASLAGWRPPLGVWTYFVLAALVGSWLVATLHRRARPAALALLEWAPLRFLGRRSYGFYLFHFVQTWPAVLWANARLGLGWGETELALAFVAADFVCALALAAVSWSLIEKPILAFRDRRPDAPSAARPPEVLEDLVGGVVPRRAGDAAARVRARAAQV